MHAYTVHSSVIPYQVATSARRMQHERTNALTELRAAGEVLATWLNHPAATAGARHMHAVHTAPPCTLSSCIHAARDALVDALEDAFDAVALADRLVAHHACRPCT